MSTTQPLRSPQETLKLLYEVSREFNSALDLRTVLQRVLFLTMRNIGAHSGSIIVVDERGEPIESAIIHGSNMLDQTTQQLRITTEQGLAGWVLRNQTAALVKDTSKDPRWLQRPDDAIDRTGPKSAISAPLAAREQLVGVITLVNSTPGKFGRQHLSLVQAIADQAGVAVLNARLYAESKRQTRVMSALAETASVINATLNLEEVLQRIAVQTRQALNVQAASLALLNDDADELIFRAVEGGAGAQLVGTRLKVGEGVAGWVAKTGQPVIVHHAHSDPRFHAETDRRTGFYTSAIACAPILQEGKIIGILEAINPQHGHFERDTLMVLNGICNLAGTAISHAQLFVQLQAAHQRYRDLFEDSLSPIVITDMEGRILEVNRQAIETSGFSQEALSRMSIMDLHEVDKKHTGAYLERLTQTDQTLIYESEMHALGDVTIPVQVLARRVSIEGVPHIQWILRDITERKHIDRLRNDLISMIYHDLRSPLSNIISSLEVLRSMLPGDDDAIKSVVQIAERSTERIQRLTNSLLDVHRLESGQPILSQEIVGLAPLVDEAIEAVRLSLDAKQQSLEVAIPSDLPGLYVDKDMIRRVLINLLDNAVKYTASQGRIRLEARMAEGMIEVSVIDTGPGIPLAEQEHIFHKFTRLRSRPGSKGLGLGLTFCRLAVEGHGGRIWVKSRVGVGSRFSITLPVAPLESLLAHSARKTSTPEQQKGKKYEQH